MSVMMPVNMAPDYHLAQLCAPTQTCCAVWLAQSGRSPSFDFLANTPAFGTLKGRAHAPAWRRCRGAARHGRRRVKSSNPPLLVVVVVSTCWQRAKMMAYRLREEAKPSSA